MDYPFQKCLQCERREQCGETAQKLADDPLVQLLLDKITLVKRLVDEARELGDLAEANELAGKGLQLMHLFEMYLAAKAAEQRVESIQMKAAEAATRGQLPN